jgi:hypothetical protein
LGHNPLQFGEVFFVNLKELRHGRIRPLVCDSVRPPLAVHRRSA